MKLIALFLIFASSQAMAANQAVIAVPAATPTSTSNVVTSSAAAAEPQDTTKPKYETVSICNGSDCHFCVKDAGASNEVCSANYQATPQATQTAADLNYAFGNNLVQPRALPENKFKVAALKAKVQNQMCDRTSRKIAKLQARIDRLNSIASSCPSAAPAASTAAPAAVNSSGSANSAGAPGTFTQGARPAKAAGARKAAQ